MKTCTFLLLIFLFAGGMSFYDPVAAQDIPRVEKNFGEAKVVFRVNKLTVSTGKVQRDWQLTGSGFQTVSFKNLATGKEWCGKKTVFTSDWGLPGKIDNNSKARLVSLECTQTDDEKFTSPHLLVEAMFRYDCNLDVKYLVRVYPGESGIWTALEVKSNQGFSAEGIPADLGYKKYYGSNQPLKIARNEFIPVDFSVANQRRYWGIYNNPGNRVNTEDMVQEKVVKGYPLFQDEENTWAIGLVIETGSDGLILLKESNKTVNRYGHQTGAFYCTPNGIEVTGWGLKPAEIGPEFKRTWATWAVAYSGTAADMQLAFKKFDRVRYPVHPERDMHILIDTWGSDWQHGDDSKIYGRENSEFSVVEKEIRSASDLGIDIVRIDDGWQEGGTMSRDSWHPNTKIGYDAHWENVKDMVQEYGVRIGLWVAIRYISLNEMLINQKELDVATWKFDFDKLEDHDSFAARVKDIRSFIKQTGYKTQTSWCPEYDDQRYGWYSPVRECGPMYFQNIQNNLPNHLIYVPYITLRHHWMLSKYFNMNQLQCHWQNPSRTNPAFSDAPLHSQSYCALSAFMAAPSCFMLTQLLQPAERDELKKIINTYKLHRAEIFSSYVFPIGNEPDNKSWAGFQICHPEKKSGFFMIFRELHNPDENAVISTDFLAGKKIKIINLETNDTEIKRCRDGLLNFRIAKAPGYLFLKYEIIN